MKKFILTSIATILSLSFNVMAASPNVIYDTMSYKNMADLKERGGWRVVGSSNTIIDESYAKLIMENDGTSVCDNGIIKEFSPYLSGFSTIEFDFMQQSEKANCRVMDLRGYQTDKNSNTRMICFIDISQGNVIARGEGHGDMGTGTVLIENYEPDIWYNIKISVDSKLNKLEFYVNNELKEQMASLQTFESISAVKFATNNATDASKEKANGANICIDNVSLSNSEKGNSIKNISVENTDGELFTDGVIVSEIDLINADSIKAREYLLFTALYKNKVIISSETATVALPFGYSDKLSCEIKSVQADESDTLELKNYLFFKTDENKYKIADAVACSDENGISFGENEFSTVVDDADFEKAEIKYTEDEISINGTLDKSNAVVNAFIFEKEIPAEWDFKKIIAIFVTKSDENKQFSIPLDLGSGLSSGKYAMLLTCDNPMNEYELYIRGDERKNFIATVTAYVEAEDDKALAEYLQNEDNLKLMKSMNIIFEEDTAYDFSGVAQYIINYCEITDKTITTSVNEAIAFSIIAKSSEADIIDNLLEYGSFIGIETDEELFANNELKDELADKLLNYDYSASGDAKDFIDYYNVSVALGALNNAEFSKIEGIILTYNDVFGIDMTEYNSLSGLKQAKVMQELAKMDIETVETDSDGNTNISKLFSEIVEDVTKKSSSNSSSGSGGGSGGGSGKTASIKLDSSVANIKTEEPAPKKRPFIDLSENHWAYDNIYYLYDNGIMSGVSEDIVDPDRAVLREEFVKMIVAAFFEIDVNAENDFSDVDRDKWFSPSISTAVKYSLIQGFDGKFGTGSNIKKQDAILILLKVAEAKGIELEESEYVLNDLDTVSDYALYAVKKMAAAGVISGDGNKNFNPLKSITRAETATLIREFMKVMK